MPVKGSLSQLALRRESRFQHFCYMVKPKARVQRLAIDSSGTIEAVVALAAFQSAIASKQGKVSFLVSRGPSDVAKPWKVEQ